jgi:Kdo2-lipid IVA lauroyltransferase/acyltransferase
MRGLSFTVLKGAMNLLSLLSLKGLYHLAQMLSPICYRFITKYRKRALSNLKLAKELNLNDKQIEEIAKKSLFHLLLTALEYAKLYRIQSIASFCKCLNSHDTDALLDKHQGVIFFCGHQSNWELLFLDATSRHQGVCIGKPQKNKKLYDLVLSIREKFKGKVIAPKDAYKGCMKALKKGELVGVVGDQGMPESSFIYECLGRKAHMTTLPALLSLRSGCPIYVATIARGYGSYEISYTGPIGKGLEDVNLITLESLKVLDESIKKHPEQYMWQHNRWKIPYAPLIPKRLRHDAILCVLPELSHNLIDDLILLKQTYEGAYFIILKPDTLQLSIEFDEIISYKSKKDCFIKHYGPKLLFDYVGIEGLEKHFMKQALFRYVKIDSFKQLSDSWKV